MEHFFKCERGKLCSFLLVFLIAFSAASAQDYEQQRKEKLSRLDLRGLGKKLFLNAGVTNQNEINYLKSLSNQATNKPELVKSDEWHNLYERLMEADLRSRDVRLPELSKWIETDPAKLSVNNVIPIGIMNLESIYLSGSELSDNEAANQAGKEVDFSEYETIRIVYASVLQEDVYQADVSFRISPGLYFSNQKEQAEQVEVDFNSGKGYEKFPVSERLIPHHFDRKGEHLIRIRFNTNGVSCVFDTKVNVRQLERIKPYREFQITAKGISQDTSAGDKSARTMLVGGSIRIILGCDQIFNKAIIIAEGIDLGQDVFLDYLETKYREPFDQYLAEGYDLVLLDYADGRAAMEDNAQVLKALIQQVNSMKIGQTKSIVIGESMSGLIARWALKEMENSGIDHQVRIMLCYDTPHQGANIPVGLTQLMHDSNATLFTQVILKFFAKGWRNYYLAFGTPAAKQLMLHWGGQLSGGVGVKHSSFANFRALLMALGNGGYPQNCRNIAVTHGSMNASDRRIFDTYNYGDRILRSWTPFGLQNTNIDLHTNQLNQNTIVLRFASWGIFSKSPGVIRSYHSALNDDFLPGGRSNMPVPNKLFNPTDSLEFCFVPTFSAIDYQGPRDTQTERELLNVSNVDAVISNRQTPFAAIYGNDENTPHVTARNIDWDIIGFAEGLLNAVPACPALPTPPTPTISNYNTCYPFSAKRTTEDNTANITIALATPSNGQYIHNWTVLPSQQAFTTTGDQITFQAERPGTYQIICVRTYPNRRDLQSSHTIDVVVSNCNGIPAGPDGPISGLVGDDDVDAADVWEGDFLLTTDADSLAVFAHYTPGDEVLYASLANGNFVPASELLASGMFEEFAALFAETDPRIALPVVLQSFHVSAEGKNGEPTAALLTWTTASEVNSNHFEIERSGSGKDWTKIASVLANILSSEPVNYSYTDRDPSNGITYYRLKMVDRDSTFAYSRIQSVRFDSDHQLAVFPNPVEKEAQLQMLLGDDKVSEIHIYNLSGKLVFQTDQPENQFNVGDLAVGRYVIKIRLEDGSESTRTFVKR